MIYEIIMRKTANHSNGEYAFPSKRETQRFLESLNNAEIEGIIEINKYPKNRRYQNAYYDFFED